MTRSARTIIFIAAGIVAISIVLTSVYTVGPAAPAEVRYDFVKCYFLQR